MELVGDAVRDREQHGRRGGAHPEARGQTATERARDRDAEPHIGERMRRLVTHARGQRSFRQRRDVENRRHVDAHRAPEEKPSSKSGKGYRSQPRISPAATNPPNRRAPKRNCSRGSSRISAAKATDTKSANSRSSPK